MLCALQHIGLGVANAANSYSFYRKCLGFNLKLADFNGSSPEMEPIIGELARMRIIMGLSSQGRGLVELVEHCSSQPRPLSLQWGDIGFLASGYRAANLTVAARQLENMGIRMVSPILDLNLKDGRKWQSVFTKDPDGNLVELVDTNPTKPRKPAIGGLAQVTIGVRDLGEAIKFYRDIVGFDEVLLENEWSSPAGAPFNQKQRQALLGKKRSLKSPFVPFDGGRIRLVQALDYKGKDVFQGRRWGDLGQMECCFQVDDIRATIAELIDKKVDIFHPPTFMNMGSGSCGYFSYIKDPDGNLVEFVEVSRIAWMKPTTLSPVFSFLSPVLTRVVR